MDATERKEIVERFRSAPGKLERSIDGLGEYQLEFRPAPGKWNIREIAIHLCDSEIVAAHRIRRVLAENDARLTSYDQDLWASNLKYGKRNLNNGVELFRLLRKSTSELFEDLTEADWERTGIHDEHGKMTLLDLVRLYAEHCENHVAQIRQIRLELSKQ
ncbi:MAG: DinB family protein [Blastocatellia bacterium]|nr:DinB family protein [Blastocatellia bacterium]MBL8192269.1 DinB family protein [Blastocatellia bacterium]MBN8724616.1 DinB family protein [Acidobacteriota bacterium]